MNNTSNLFTGKAFIKLTSIFLVFLLAISLTGLNHRLAAAELEPELETADEYLQELIDVALEESFSYQELFHELEAARSQEDQLEAGLDWRGDVIADMDVQKTPDFLQNFYEWANEEVDDQFAVATLTLAASRSLWDDAETAYQRQALQVNIEDSLLALTRKEQELITSVAESYYDFRQAQIGARMAERAAEVREEQVEEKRFLLEADEATETDLQEVKLEAEEAQDRAEEAEEMLNLARENLRQEVGTDRLPPLPQPEEFETAEKIAIPEEASPWPWDLYRSQEIARGERLDLQRLEQSIELVEAEKDRVSAEHEPDISGNLLYYQPDVESTFNVELDDSGRVIAGVSRSENTLPELDEIEVEEEDLPEWVIDLVDIIQEGQNDIPFNDLDDNQNFNEFAPDENEEPINNQQNIEDLENDETEEEEVFTYDTEADSFWQVSVSVEYNFYDSGLKEAELDELQAEKSAREQELAEAREGIGLEVKAQWQDLEASHRNLQRKKSGLDLAKSRLADGEELLETDMISQYEYNLLELNYYRSAQEVLEAQYEFKQERARMAEVLGLSTDWFKGEL